MRFGSLVVVGVVVVVVGGGCSRAPGPVNLDRPLLLGGRTVTPERLRRGAAAYSHYCRPCHGDTGDGAGASGRGLDPPPRDLRLGVYKFAAVSAGQLPNDEDFRRIIKGGLHGTAMLAWDVPDPELYDLIQYVKAFSPRWQTEKPGEPIAMSRDPWAGRDDAAVDRGNRVYHGLAQCAVACHPAYATRPDIFAFTQELTQMRVEEFRADLYAPVPKPSDFGVAIVPPDFTFHPLRAGDSVADIARTIAAGIGGTAMPTWKNVLPDLDLWAMAYFVRSLVALRDTPAAHELGAKLRAQPAWTPPPLPDAGADGGDGGLGGVPGFPDCVLQPGESRPATRTHKAPGGAAPAVEPSPCALNASCIHKEGQKTRGDARVEIACKGKACICTVDSLGPRPKTSKFRIKIPTPCATTDDAKRLLRERCMYGLKPATPTPAAPPPPGETPSH